MKLIERIRDAREALANARQSRADGFSKRSGEAEFSNEVLALIGELAHVAAARGQGRTLDLLTQAEVAYRSDWIEYLASMPTPRPCHCGHAEGDHGVERCGEDVHGGGTCQCTDGQGYGLMTGPDRAADALQTSRFEARQRLGRFKPLWQQPADDDIEF